MTNDSETLVNDHLYLLSEIAIIRYKMLLKVHIRHIKVEELENEGYLGLLLAAEKYNPDIGNDFSEFARYYINNAISQFLRKEDVVDHRSRKKIKDMLQCEQNLQQKLKREATNQEIADELNITEEQVVDLKLKNMLILSLDNVESVYSIKIHEIHSNQLSEQRVLNNDLAKATDDCLKRALTNDELFIVLMHELRDFTANDIVIKLNHQYTAQQVYRMLKVANIKIKKCIELKGWQVSDLNI